MKNMIRIIGALFAIIKLSTASEFNTNNQHYLINNQIKSNTIEYYATFSEMHQNIKPFHNSIDEKRKIKIERNVNGQIINMKWNAKDKISIEKNRDFEYHENGLLKKIIDYENNEILKTIILGQNDIGKAFFNYIFSPGFTPRKYNYFTETHFINGLPVEHNIISMNDHVIGKISKTYDKQSHLIKEIWFRSESNKFLRDFTSIFNHETGHYNVIERDGNGKIINHEFSLIN